MIDRDASVDRLPAQRSHREVMLALSGLLVGLFLAAIEQTIVGTALPAMVGDLGGIAYLSWVIVGYLLTSTATTPLWGKVGDLYGRKRMFQMATGIFIAASVLCALAPTMVVLVAGRLLQGVGGGGLYSLVFGIVADLVPPRERGRYISYFAATFAFAGLIGPLVGGIFTDQLSWRWIFLVNLPVGLACMVVTARTLHLPHVRREVRLDLVGALVLVLGVGSLVLCTAWGGGRYAWSSAPIIGLGVAAVALLVGFCLWELRATEPILSMRLFRNPVIAMMFLLSFLIGPLYYGAAAFVPLYMEGVRGASATAAGLMLAPNAVGNGLAAIVTGRLTLRNGRYKRWLVSGGLASSAALAGLSRLDAHWSPWAIGSTMVVMGAGAGMAIPVVSTASQNAAELGDTGIVTAAVQFFRALGGSFGIAALSAVLRFDLDGRLDSIARTNALPEGMTARALADRPDAIREFTQPLRGLVERALSHSIALVFLTAVPLGVGIFLLSLRLEERPLRTTVAAATAASGDTPIALPAE